MSVELGRWSLDLDDCLSLCNICAQSNLNDLISFCVYHRSDLDAYDRLFEVTAIILNSEKDTLFLIFFILVVAKDGEVLSYRRR